METIRQQIIDEARTYLGVRFRHQGRNRNGVDCAGLLILVFEKILGKEFDITGYARRPKPKDMLRELKKKTIRIGRDEAVPGDIVLLCQGAPTHLALLTDKGILHGTIEYRKVVEQRIDDRVQSEIIGYFRLKELINHG